MNKYDLMVKKAVQRAVLSRAGARASAANKINPHTAIPMDDKESYAFICASEMEKYVGGVVDDVTFNSYLEECRQEYDCINLASLSGDNPTYIALVNRFGEVEANSRWDIIRKCLCMNKSSLHMFLNNLVNGLEI